MYHQETFNQNPLKNIPPAVETTFNFQRLKDGYFAFRKPWVDGAGKLTIGLLNDKLCEFYLRDVDKSKVEMISTPIQSISAENLSANDWLYATDPMGFNVLKSQKSLMWGCNISAPDKLFINQP